MKEPYLPPKEPRSKRRRIRKKYFKNCCRWMYWDLYFVDRKNPLDAHYWKTVLSTSS